VVGLALFIFASAPAIAQAEQQRAMHKPPDNLDAWAGYQRGLGHLGNASLGDLVLHCKDVGEIAVVALGPDMVADLGLDQLRSDADPIAGFTQAAFEHISHTQLASDLFHIDREASVGQGRYRPFAGLQSVLVRPEQNFGSTGGPMLRLYSTPRRVAHSSGKVPDRHPASVSR